MVIRSRSWAGSGCARALSGLACWLTLVFTAGCQTVLPPGVADLARQPPELGQEAPRQAGPEQAGASADKNPPVEPDPARNHLNQAAACLEQGDEEHACPHLARYLAAYPDHLVVRGHYAE